MKYFFANFKTIIVEIIGIIGGFIWVKYKGWDPEPIILLVASSVGLIISLFSIFFQKKNVEPTNQHLLDVLNNDKEITNSSSLPFTDIEPCIIKNKIKNAPLFQQEEIANHFLGLNVQWTLKLFLIHKIDDGKIVVMLEPMDNTYMTIEITTSVDEHPVLKISDKGKVFIVSGKIVKCKVHSIELEIIDLREKQ